jgi:hypothetical protein
MVWTYWLAVVWLGVDVVLFLTLAVLYYFKLVLPRRRWVDWEAWQRRALAAELAAARQAAAVVTGAAAAELGPPPIETQLQPRADTTISAPSARGRRT